MAEDIMRTVCAIPRGLFELINVGDGQYWAPNDAQAASIESISHHIFLLTLNDKLFVAPINNPKRVLDIGTGIGIWALDFADQFPSTEIIATDLSPIQPDCAPPNLRFEIDDCCSVWVYPKNDFDFIHIRLLYASVADWPVLYRECYDHLTPGGYIEQLEMSVVPKSDDGSLEPGDMWDEFAKLAIESGERFGKTFLIQERMKDLITQAGFEDVVELKYKWPIGAWSTDQKLKDLGNWNMHHWNEGLEGWNIALLTRLMGWTYNQVKEWNAKMRLTMRDRRYHAYQEVSVVYARKPMGRSRPASTGADS
ncbi:hypothetical protein MMC07_003209 [Pseudocyphellaria aurata]|nr:hypothetical protein [Pseudocyphellaria aurata]